MEYDADPDWRTHIASLKADHLEDVVGRVETAAVAGAPVDTGAMAASVPVYTEISGDTGKVGTSKHYGIFVEEGHRVAYKDRDGNIVYTGDVVPPQPWLRPALYSQGGG